MYDLLKARVVNFSTLLFGPSPWKSSRTLIEYSLSGSRSFTVNSWSSPDPDTFIVLTFDVAISIISTMYFELRFNDVRGNSKVSELYPFLASFKDKGSSFTV